MAQLHLIACMAANRVIGRDGQIPWHFNADLQHFKTITLGHTVLMGRRTFESIGRALPKRRNLVLTSGSLSAPDIEAVRSLRQALALVGTEEKIFIIGGQQLYAESLAQAACLHLTCIEQDFAGDTYFPDFSALPFRQVECARHFDEENQFFYTFETWALT